MYSSKKNKAVPSKVKDKAVKSPSFNTDFLKHFFDVTNKLNLNLNQHL